MNPPPHQLGIWGSAVSSNNGKFEMWCNLRPQKSLCHCQAYCINSLNNYVRQVNEVKLADILFYLRFRPSIRPSICVHSYLDANISKAV